MRKLLHISYLEHKTNDCMWSKINFLVGPQEPLLEIVERQKLAWFRHVTHHDTLQNHPLGHLGGWATLWSAEKMLDGQHQRADIPAHARTAHNGLLQETLDKNLCLIVCHVPSDDPISHGTELN